MADLASALLCGGCVAFFLSGVLGLQVFHYLRLHKTERWTRVVAFTCCFIDFAHLSFTFLALFHHLVPIRRDISATVHYSVPLALVFTGLQSFSTHTSKAFLIHQQRRNWFLTGPLIFNSFIALACMSSCAIALFTSGSFVSFSERVPGFLLTAALSLSTALDHILTILACATLHRLSGDSAKSYCAPDTRTQVSLGSGLLASVSTGSAMLCWVSAPTHFFYFGLLYVVAKVHANTLIFDFHFAYDPSCTDLPQHVSTADLYTRPSSPVARHKRKRMESLTSVTEWASIIHVPKNVLARSPPPSPPRIEVMIERTVEYGVGTYSSSTWCRPTSTVTSLASGSSRGSGARGY